MTHSSIIADIECANTNNTVSLRSYFIAPHMYPKLVTSGQHFLAEGNEIGRRFQIPMLVGPKLAGGSASGLNLVHDKGSAKFVTQLLKLAKEGRRRVIVAALGLNRLNNDSCTGMIR